MLKGRKTYIVVAMMLLCVVVETVLGVDVPGVTIGANWLQDILAAAGLGTLRAAVK
jgi:hypothetical protein